MEEWIKIDTIRIETRERSGATRRAYPDWPCRRGCDECCRNLAALPDLTPMEWQEVERGLAGLSGPARAAVELRIAAAALNGSGPYVCPFLDPAAGACLIYAYRPIACRTYGYYADARGRGLYCATIRRREESGELAGVVWGNQDAVEARLDELGPRIGLAEWADAHSRG